jgi:hypothetical protein
LPALEVYVLRATRRILIILLVLGFSVLFLAGCSNDNGTGPVCVNCDFWQKALSGAGRFPAAHPEDPRLIAFTSQDTDSLCTAQGYSHLWIAELSEFEGVLPQRWQVTCDAWNDYKPVWSPDGKTLAFERRFGGGLSEIFTVDVSSPAYPGDPVEITSRSSMPEANYSPAWMVVGAETLLAFSNSVSGGNDYDLMGYAYPSLGRLDTLTVDPSDFAFARNPQDPNGEPLEGGALGAMFKDQQVCGNGTALVAFVSPERVGVCDIRVVARTEETAPETSASAAISINGKVSTRFTPYTFRYRPAGDAIVEVVGSAAGYCTRDTVRFVPRADTVNTIALDFQYYHGTVGFTSDPGVKVVYLDGRRIEGVRTPPDTTTYIYVNCVLVGTHRAYAANIWPEVACSDTSFTFPVVAGETTLVTLRCPGALESPAVPGPAAESRPALQGAASMPVLASSAAQPYGVWLMEFDPAAAAADQRLYRVAASATPISEPALSSDGRYVAYIAGLETSRQIVVADVGDLLQGTGPARTMIVGMPGESGDLECWRIPERVAWMPASAGRKIVASISKCGTAEVPGDYEIWIADLSGFIE